MILYSTLLVITCVFYVYAYPSYINLIPNGNNINYTECNTTWPAVGHVYPTYQGSDFPRNQFGQDFLNSSLTWTTELCNKDSDGDTVSNGDELGFGNCTQASDWVDDPNSVTLTTPLGHPGVCEPRTNNIDCTAANADIQCSS